MMEQLLIAGSKVSNTNTASNNNAISDNSSEAPSVTMNKNTMFNIYLSLGFKCILMGRAKQLQCVICSRTLSSESLKPKKLKPQITVSVPHSLLLQK
jgi:hypothetical protein